MRVERKQGEERPVLGDREAFRRRMAGRFMARVRRGELQGLTLWLGPPEEVATLDLLAARAEAEDAQEEVCVLRDALHAIHEATLKQQAALLTVSEVRAMARKALDG